MGKEKGRKAFLDKLVTFNKEKGIPVEQCPLAIKRLVDLFKMYTSVKEKGGYAEVCKKKLWKDVCGFVMGKDSSAPLAYTLKRHYNNLILAYECKYDRNGIDPQKLITQFEVRDKKKAKPAPAPSPTAVDSNSQSSYPQATTPVSSDGSNLSGTNKSAEKANGQAVASTPVKENKKSSPAVIQTNNNLSTPSMPVSKQPPPQQQQPPQLPQQQQQPPPGAYNLNHNQKPPTMQPNYGQPANLAPPQSQSQMSPFRPPSVSSQYPMSGDPNHSGDSSSLNSSLNNSLNHSEQFPTQQQLNNSSSPAGPYPPHHPHHSQATAEHYQNMARTHSPLAQRLMQQQKSSMVSALLLNNPVI